MLSKYQVMIADFYNIPIGTVKKSASNFFDKEEHVLHYETKMYIRILHIIAY